MESVKTEKYLDAFEQLFAFTSNKRFGIVDSTITISSLTDEAHLIIDDIKEYYNLKKSIRESDELSLIIGFEEKLSDYLTVFTREEISGKRDYSDEIKLFDEAHIVSIDSLANLNINFKDGLDPYKRSRIDVNFLNKKELKTNITAVSQITRALSSEPMYFVTGKVHYRKSEKIVFYTALKKENSFEYDCSLLMLLDFKTYDDMVNHPIRLFLKIIDYYGAYLSDIDDKKKLIYKRYTYPSDLEKLVHRFKNKKSDPFSYLHITSDPSSLSHITTLGFLLNLDDYFNDFRRNFI